MKNIKKMFTNKEAVLLGIKLPKSTMGGSEKKIVAPFWPKVKALIWGINFICLLNVIIMFFINVIIICLLNVIN